MCFSATASFGSAAILAVIGIATVRKTTSRKQVAFAGLPFIFAIQQLAEGFVWVSLTNNAFAEWQEPASNLFLIFALVLWPIWIPLSILLLEKNYQRKSILYFLLAIGILVAGYFSYSLLTFPVMAVIENSHIFYHVEYPGSLITSGNLMYGLATILPTFISSARRIWLLGVCVILSYMATRIFFPEHIISVWCYFAALISCVVYWIIIGQISSPGKLYSMFGVIPEKI